MPQPSNLPTSQPSNLLTSQPSSQPTCPSCGRFVGPYDICPYCGARRQRRLSLRATQYGAIILAVVGLLVLYLVARRVEVPLVKIADIQETMNWAYVALEGTVTRYPSYDPTAGQLSFWLDDGSGEIMVSAYKNEAEELQEAGLVPTVGDWVHVEGSLKVREDFFYLILNVPRRMRIEPPAPLSVNVGDLNLGMAYQVVKVRGVVREVRSPYEGLTIIEVRDATGSVDVAIPEALVHLSGPPPEVQPGQAVQVIGAVTPYGSTPQLSLRSADSLTFLHEPLTIAPQVTIAELSPDHVGKLVQVEGRIVKVKSFSQGVKFILDDGTGRITVLLWQDVRAALPNPECWSEGALAVVTGEIQVYRDELEIVPEMAADLVLIAAGEVAEATPTPTPVTPRPIGDITAADVGRSALVEGTIVEAKSFSQGMKYTLDDGTGTIILLLWQDVYQAAPDREGLQVGAQVRARGQVKEYKGALEIVPEAGADVVVIAAAPTPTPVPLVRIADITSGWRGRTVTIAGEIVQQKEFSKGWKLFVDDGTAQITVLLWQNVYETVPEREKLVVGARIQVTGEVDEYKGELEVVPRRGEDVVVQ